ncbi:EAL domain-containing protein [Aestuariicella sp. G3-2]|uniref:putative bifunctional diguanylate cyclase/phosphodiesterase n=1 Tax=Pseudomaricurvus albidus TaxID=2842452 RepID=UPI001C0C9939|nr:EAL domain-containing protein [Aestuariicella albida]MBU3070199.1 EAL domain-containing protein [Aestuariicella albida]
MNKPAPIPSLSSSPEDKAVHTRGSLWPFKASLFTFILLCLVFSAILWLQHKSQESSLRQLNIQTLQHQQHQFDHFTEQFRQATQTAIQKFVDYRGRASSVPAATLQDWWQEHANLRLLAAIWRSDTPAEGIHTSNAGDIDILQRHQAWFDQTPDTEGLHSGIHCHADECIELSKIDVIIQGKPIGQLRIARDIHAQLTFTSDSEFPGITDIPGTQAVGLLRVQKRSEQSWQFQYIKFPQGAETTADSEPDTNSSLPLPLDTNLALWKRIQQHPVSTQEASVLAPTRGIIWSMLTFPEGYADNHYLLQRSDASPLAWQQHQHLMLLAIIYIALTLLISLIIFLTFQRFSQRLHDYASLLPLLGQKQYQLLREKLRKLQGNHWSGELNEAEASLSTLSYQLEAQEKTVDIRTQEVERLSLFDPLTGLANRHLLQYEIQSDLEHLSQSPRDNLVAILLLDLDNFKRINDSLGHQYGDVILQKMAKRLKGAIHSLGLVARLGGDEFAILLRSARRPEQLQILCQKILGLVQKPLVIDQTSLVISCSIGISTASLEDTPEDLLKHAEIAMYKAKQSGGNSHRLFNAKMAAEAHDNLSLESELRRGFEESEFTLYLQPKVSMDGIIKGFESLVRWDHPDRGILPPSEFIPAMENMGFISMLDNWVLEASFRQLKVLEPHYPDIILAVNISSTHFTKESFLVFLHECLQKYPINPSRLELEITETLLMKNMSAGLEVIRKIKEMGVRIAIDDFGTGYSSLSYLKNLPVDTLKIDQEFIKDIPDSESDMQISSVIIFLAKQLHFSVVAEGVETAQQLSFLKSNHCDLAQGYFFSKPIPAHKAILMLESERIDLANSRTSF